MRGACVFVVVWLFCSSHFAGFDVLLHATFKNFIACFTCVLTFAHNTFSKCHSRAQSVEHTEHIHVCHRRNIADIDLCTFRLRLFFQFTLFDFFPLRFDIYFFYQRHQSPSAEESGAPLPRYCNDRRTQQFHCFRYQLVGCVGVVDVDIHFDRVKVVVRRSCSPLSKLIT